MQSIMTNAMQQLIRSKSGRLWEMCIGLEIHAQVLSHSKLMSGAPASQLASASPNMNVSFFDAALPGTLPVINRECVHQAIRASCALNATIHPRSVFERKHYFYCDLPLGYQLTQQRAPIATDGMLHFDLPAASLIDHNEDTELTSKSFDGSKYSTRKEKNEALKKWKEAQQKRLEEIKETLIPRSVRVARIQIEQDSGKSIHDLVENHTVVDLNRAGTALLEIVMEPDLRSPTEAGIVMKKLQHLLRHLDICDGNMEEGSMRCDLNVSVREILDKSLSTDQIFGERVEVKNMNSIRHMMKAAEYEAHRQIELIETTGEYTQVTRETRSFDAVTGETKRMRSKETAKDYRFFPEPDLPPLVISTEDIQSLADTLPLLPDAIKENLMAKYTLSANDAALLINEPGAVQYFERIMNSESMEANQDKKVSLALNWITNELMGHLKALKLTVGESPVSSNQLDELLSHILTGVVSGRIAKQVLEILVFEQQPGEVLAPTEIIKSRGWMQIQDEEEIRKLCIQVLEDKKSAKNIENYLNGKTKLFAYFIGQAMKLSGGRINPEQANKIMVELLEERRSINRKITNSAHHQLRRIHQLPQGANSPSNCS